mmetsp:Transcript_650/g.1072  ORF Transcript_650/g.1072 Transcript_650/m.1072 type:complete len:222 (-) Transcript_650:391-1056(-)
MGISQRSFPSISAHPVQTFQENILFNSAAAMISRFAVRSVFHLVIKLEFQSTGAWTKTDSPAGSVGIVGGVAQDTLPNLQNRLVPFGCLQSVTLALVGHRLALPIASPTFSHFSGRNITLSICVDASFIDLFAHNYRWRNLRRAGQMGRCDVGYSAGVEVLQHWKHPIPVTCAPQNASYANLLGMLAPAHEITPFSSCNLQLALDLSHIVGRDIPVQLVKW